MYRTTYLEINLDKIEKNIKNLMNFNKEYKHYFGVVKANAYNHGKYAIEEIIKNGINYLCVSSLEEAIEIRKFNKEIPILCLEIIDLEYIEEIIKNNITITISKYEYYLKLQKLKNQGEIEKIENRYNNNLKIHIKLNTGMNRLGIKEKEEFKEIVNNFKIEGIYSHLATVDSNIELCNNQQEKFIEYIKEIDYKKIEIIHLFNSSAGLKFKKMDICNGIRLGISMYGINKNEKNIDLETVMSLKSNIMQINNIKKDEFVGYDAKYIADKECKVGVIPVGYADGFIKQNEGREVIINNKRYKIIGNICMDMTMIEIDNNVEINDEVILFGENIEIEEVAKYIDTISYEIFCSINDRVTRKYIKKNEVFAIENYRYNLIK